MTTTPDADARVYRCDDCGTMRSKNEGGTVFSVCDACWDKHYRRAPSPLPAEGDAAERERLEHNLDRLLDETHAAHLALDGAGIPKGPLPARAEAAAALLRSGGAPAAGGSEIRIRGWASFTEPASAEQALSGKGFAHVTVWAESSKRGAGQGAVPVTVTYHRPAGDDE